MDILPFINSVVNRRFLWITLAWLSVGLSLSAQVSAPTFSPGAGNLKTYQNVTVATTSGTTLRITTTGTAPIASDPSTPAPATVLVSRRLVLKASTWSGTQSSPVTTGSYTVSGDIGAGGYHVLSLRFDGILAASGSNSFGQLGNGSTLSGTAFTVVDTTSLPFQVSAFCGGEFHTLALTTGSEVRAWGRGGHGQLGNNNTIDKTTAVVVKTGASGNPALTDIIQIAAGGRHSLALSSVSGYVWAFGKNANSQLAQGDTTNRSTAEKVLANSGGTKFTGATSIAAGAEHSLIVKTGTVYAFGDNTYRQCKPSGATATFPTAVSGITNATSVASGPTSNTSYAITTGSTVYAWGLNDHGQVGNNSFTTPISTPTLVTVSSGTLSGIVQAAAGTGHALFLKGDGSVWACGSNAYGQLGIGTSGTDVPYAVRVMLSGSTPLSGVVAIAAGADSSYALTADGLFYAWGANYAGQLAMSATVSSLSYATLGTYSTGNLPPTVTLSAVTASGAELANLSVSGTASDPNGNGINRVDLSMDGSLVSTFTNTPTFSYTATLVPAGSHFFSAQATDVFNATGSVSPTVSGTVPLQTVVASTSGTVDEGTMANLFTLSRSPGNPTNKDLVVYYSMEGTATQGTDYSTLSGTKTIIVGSGSATIPVTATLDTQTEGNETIALRITQGGYNGSGTVVTGTIIDHPPLPAPTFYPDGSPYVKIDRVMLSSTVPGVTIRYTTDGSTPTGSSQGVPSGTLIRLPISGTVRAISTKVNWPDSPLITRTFTGSAQAVAGSTVTSHVLVYDGTGGVWGWGYNNASQVKNGSNPVVRFPIRLDISGQISGISAGICYSEVLLQSGTVLSWGSNLSGNLGQGDLQERTVPTAIASLGDVRQIASKRLHTLAVAGAVGQVWAWGVNSYSQLGDRTTTTGTSPVATKVLINGQYADLTGIASVAAGDEFSLALSTTGSVWAFGLNNNGTLGVSGLSSSNYAIPAAPTILNHIVAISAGPNFALALKDDGSVWSWGANFDGQLGDGSTLTTGYTPRRVKTSATTYLENVVDIAACDSCSFALTRDGALWAWGSDSDGRLGNGALSAGVVYATKVMISGSAIRMMSGGVVNGIWKSDGTLWVWGFGNFGQMGDGGNQNSVSPTKQNGIGYRDSDSDGMLDWEELANGTNLLDVDTNGDGMSDAQDRWGFCSAADDDVDGDGILNPDELRRGLNPFQIDTDGDGVSDSVDVYPSDPTRSAATAGDTTPPIITITFPSGGVTPL